MDDKKVCLCGCTLKSQGNRKQFKTLLFLKLYLKNISKMGMYYF